MRNTDPNGNTGPNDQSAHVLRTGDGRTVVCGAQNMERSQIAGELNNPALINDIKKAAPGPEGEKISRQVGKMGDDLTPSPSWNPQPGMRC